MESKYRPTVTEVIVYKHMTFYLRLVRSIKICKLFYFNCRSVRDSHQTLLNSLKKTKSMHVEIQTAM